ncbi:hypothetical protein KUTeg_020245 [Tegillarca granosa]|uniref:DAGKc domain-containing protein n=1 Tax=Tegillarca granosa TaxID=220873 RepID=A0ABQ9EDA3_TEGGR|nr:hypothetical protein KUTeg_020245 [Tegillarca granosa]
MIIKYEVASRTVTQCSVSILNERIDDCDFPMVIRNIRHLLCCPVKSLFRQTKGDNRTCFSIKSPVLWRKVMADIVDNTLLQSTLDVNEKAHQVTLTSSHILWGTASNGWDSDSPSSEPFLSHNYYSNIIEIKNIFAVSLEQNPKSSHEDFNKGFQRNSKPNTPLYIEMRDMRPRSFSVHFVKRCRWKLKHKKITFTCNEAFMCQLWLNKIKDIISNPAFKRPKGLLVFVNPFGGKRKGPKIYAEKVAPLFDLAEIKVHAITSLSTFMLSISIIRVVVVGGDGMFSEVLNGLLDRRMREAGLKQTIDTHPLRPDLRIGIIPAGSTDTIVYTSTGINDPVTSALHIILGSSVGIDVCSLYTKDQFLKYSVSFLSYGYYGDMLKDSEKNRWMGPSRYQLSGAKKFVTKKTYEGEVSFLLSSESRTSPRDKLPCLAGCHICDMAAESYDQQISLRNANSSHSKDKESGIISSAPDAWHRVRGRFLAISSFTMSCRCSLSPHGVSPACHLGDGTTDLMIIQDCSRIDFLRHLIRCADKTADQFDFDFIKIYRVKEFIFTSLPLNAKEVDADTEEKGDNSCQPSGACKQLKPKSPTRSVWNCDGEVIDQQNLHVRIHCQLVNLFATGIIEPEPDVQCPSCCSNCDKESIG